MHPDEATGSGDGALALNLHMVETQASIFSSLERRVALEVGCSLPIRNSPMVDHQRETPDFVLGRWIWRSDPRIESNDRGSSRRYTSAMPSCTEYQGSTDRITYHELRPQAKIQTLRIKLFARLRTFNDEDEEPGGRCPQQPDRSGAPQRASTDRRWTPPMLPTPRMLSSSTASARIQSGKSAVTHKARISPGSASAHNLAARFTGSPM